MSDWNIHRRDERCAACQRPFVEGEAIYSLLFLEGERLRREDRCPPCFQGPPAEVQGSGLLFWRTHHTLDRRARFAVDFEALSEFFLALDGRPEPRLQELRYLLALLLLRKKRLKLVGVRRNAAGETLCLRRPRRAEEFLVQVFELDAERAQVLRAELARVFEGAGIEALLAPAATAAKASGGTQVAEAAAGERAS